MKQEKCKINNGKNSYYIIMTHDVQYRKLQKILGLLYCYTSSMPFPTNGILAPKRRNYGVL